MVPFTYTLTKKYRVLSQLFAAIVTYLQQVLFAACPSWATVGFRVSNHRALRVEIERHTNIEKTITGVRVWAPCGIILQHTASTFKIQQSV